MGAYIGEITNVAKLKYNNNNDSECRILMYTWYSAYISYNGYIEYSGYTGYTGKNGCPENQTKHYNKLCSYSYL